MGLVRFIRETGRESQLPIQVAKDRDYLPHLCNILNNYKDAVGQESALTSYAPVIGEICDSIIRAVKTYYGGQPAFAYEILHGLFLERRLDKELAIRRIGDVENGREHKVLYRGRVGQHIALNKDLFHVPFSHRQYVGTERYSIPGIPCLYLAGSIYCCWIELNKPHLQDFYVSRFEAEKNIKVLDLAMHPWDLVTGNGSDGPHLISYCLLWPFLCATSFTVKEENRAFKSEYIVSQLLSQLVTATEEIDGIRYLSTRMPAENKGYRIPLYVNYVFPAKQGDREEYSKILSDNFQLTHPFCTGEFDLLSESNLWTVKNLGEVSELRQENINPRRCAGAIRVTRGKITEYAHTKFFEIENLLQNLPVYPMCAN